MLVLVLVPAAAGTALGLGAIVPKFEERSYLNVERAHPSQFASFGFLFGEMIVGAIGFLLVPWALSGTPIAVGASLLYAVIVVSIGALGYLYAVRKFDSFTLDDL